MIIIVILNNKRMYVNLLQVPKQRYTWKEIKTMNKHKKIIKKKVKTSKHR